ncbi:carbohydrate ABC transporter permease [Paenibacillus apiarius]|uniref:Carbohydrate ABC transporter permease n=1 Tax=Paenibacillus apiarius TaxID=46240 RepID=A0ABT4DWJ5_9BACL|nr:carbohydrate ABC transporter permease [Paenibacillus apiarius]MBN3526603.1 carbohydrate ABC transporter permease [Paenibacillus apiarius]MCY9513029.1 carbohydrate ABC transporter permease [Paenibacillus apiarius]MCY9521615.1 carbohydrate ABC transporter permease [Paenibacillus apiarius]MCY9551767.1 carbohydrate ABC transporter permease [Paenibacillus apiarius]MCY9560444.1 carbohydrate ABC transporter permease [Paenibacillus apiarius]
MKKTLGRRLFLGCNFVFLAAISCLCLMPIIHILAISFSSGAAASAGKVLLWPVEFSTAAYQNVFGKPEYLRAFWVSLQRVLLGTSLSMFLTILTAYPLSRDSRQFRLRTAYVWIFVFTILFNGGLIPWYMTIKTIGLIDSLWALVLPGAVQVFNIILLLNFYRNLPKELEESSRIDGAGHFTTLWKIYVPLSLPALATTGLFTMVGHWNSWFDGMILMNHPDKYPLQTFLQTIIINLDFRFLKSQDAELMIQLSDRTSKAAQIFVAAFPILIVYPFLQKFFIKGIVMGSVKE